MGRLVQLSYMATDFRNEAACFLLGHSHIVRNDTGHLTCARCDEIVDRSWARAIIGIGGKAPNQVKEEPISRWDKFLVPSRLTRGLA